MIQRAGVQASGGEESQQPAKKDRAGDGQYQGLNNKQLINTLRDRDNRIQDLVDALEILELKSKKLEQLVNIKDAELRVWQNK